MRLLLLRLSLVLVAALPLETSAYVTSPNAVPVNHQIKYLKQLTTNLVEAAPGELSDSQLSTSHDLMYAWSHLPPKANAAATRGCALQVESIVKRLIEERRAGNLDADLTVDDYNCLLEGWARAGRGEASAHRTEQILEGMQQHGPAPNLASFKACLMAWRHSGVPYAAVRAQRILEWMIRLHSSGENKQALPDQDCFDMVLQVWSRSGNPQAPQKTEQLLGVMEQLHRSTGLAQLKPRKTSFNAVLAAHSKASNNRGQQQHPLHNAQRAADILSFMELLAETDPAVAPDSASYNTVMNGYARAGGNGNDASVRQAAQQADAFLRHVVKVYKKQQQQESSSRVDNNNNNNDPQQISPRIQPDTILFNTAIGLWAKTGRPGSFRRARSILDRQLDLVQNFGCVSAAPDVVGVTSVLGSCAAETRDRSKAWDVAVATYRQLAAGRALGCAPNHVTYGTMMKACARLLPYSPVRRQWLRAVWADAVAAGPVGDMVVSKLREAAAPDLYRELMEGHSRKRLPAAWTANVREQSGYRGSSSNNNKKNKQQKQQKRRKRAEV